MAKIEEGICPYCGSDDLNYGTLDIGDDCVNYPVLCLKCKGVFTESYDLYFSGQSLDDINGRPYVFGGEFYEEDS